MKDIAIYGAGGLGREVACLIRNINAVEPQWNLIGFFDDGVEIGKPVSHFGKVLGGLNALNTWEQPLAVAIAIGSPQTVSLLTSQITNTAISFPNLIDPSFYVGDTQSFSIGRGNIIQGCCVATVDISIGNFNILNGYIVLGHDVALGDCNVLMPGCRISGGVKIGTRNIIGADSFVLQNIKIGQDVILSPLSALLTQPKDGTTYIGNPAKKLKY